jgi:hypothetical protein
MTVSVTLSKNHCKNRSQDAYWHSQTPACMAKEAFYSSIGFDKTSIRFFYLEQTPANRIVTCHDHPRNRK